MPLSASTVTAFLRTSAINFLYCEKIFTILATLARKVGSMTVGDNTISGSPVKKRPRLSLKKHGSQGEEQKKEVKLTSEINENTSDSPPTGDNAPW